MQNLTCKLSIDKKQRMINGIIFLCLLAWIIAKLRYVYYASDITVHYKYDLLKLITLTYLAQTILNRNWLNSVIKGIYVALIIFVLCTFIYSFFDENDFVMQKEFGVLIKSWGTLVKLSILFIILWFTNKIRPVKNNASNSHHGANPQISLRNKE